MQKLNFTMKASIIIFFVFISTQFVFAKNDTLYFSKSNAYCKKKEAVGFRMVYQMDSIHIQVRDYWMNKKLKAVGYTKAIPYNFSYKKEGLFHEYYDNGVLKEKSIFVDDELFGLQKLYFKNSKLFKSVFHENKKDEKKATLPPFTKEVWDSLGNQLVKDGFGKSKEFNEDLAAIEEGIYKNGLKDSVWTGCYTNGKLCYRENYQEGKFIKGTSNDTFGETYSYEQISEAPEFKGGLRELYNFIATNLRYPFDAQKIGVSGKVFVKFVVEKDGSIQDVFVLHSIFPSLDREAIDTIKKTSKKWNPGKQRGMLVRVFFTMPISFILE